MDPRSLYDLAKTAPKSRLHLENGDHDDLEPRTPLEAQWLFQSRWVKAPTFLIGVPSFGYRWFAGFTDPFQTSLGTVNVIGFAFVSILQMLFVFRAYWRMDV
jgi:hypothetical protein